MSLNTEWSDDQEAAMEEARNVGHALRRAIYGPQDALCTTCVICGALWWCPAPPPAGKGLVPEVCPGSKGRVPPIIAAGMAWVEGIPDEQVDAVNARLIEFGMGMKVADYRVLAATHGRNLSRFNLDVAAVPPLAEEQDDDARDDGRPGGGAGLEHRPRLFRGGPPV